MLATGIAALAATDSLGRKRRPHCLAALAVALIFSNPVLAQTQVDGGTQAEFHVWRTTTIGSHKGVDGYRNALEAAKMKIGNAADEILGRPAFNYARERLDVELTLVSAAQLGVEAGSTLADLYRRATQAGLVLCPPDVAPQLRLDYHDQPLGESLLIAMEPVKTYYGDPTILSLVNFGSGLALLGSDGRSDSLVSGYLRFVFALPVRTAQTD